MMHALHQSWTCWSRYVSFLTVVEEGSLHRERRGCASRCQNCRSDAGPENELEIQSNAYRQVQQIRGEADAKATEIYARASRKIRRPPSSTPSSRPRRLITKSSPKIPPWCSRRTATYLPC